MANAMVALANITLASSASTVTFSSIPATYRDLRLVINYTLSANPTARDSFIAFNGDTGANYSYVYMYGSGSSTGSSSVGSDNNIQWPLDASGSRITTIQMNIMDYSATDKHKTVIMRADDAGYMTLAEAGRWASTSAITSMMITSGDSGSRPFIAGSTFSLYGIVS